MSVVEKILSGQWEHDEAEQRIEDIAAYNPEITDQMHRIALRFISAKGLSDEFADALEQIQSVDNLAHALGTTGETDADLALGI